MATIKTSCVICGDVELRAPLMYLFIYENAIERSYYSFSCPVCHDEVVKDADGDIIDLLLAAVPSGLNVTRVMIPDEVFETENAVGFAITADDVLDFCLAMDQRDVAEALTLEIEQRRLKPTA